MALDRQRGKWADEISGSEPLPELEPFYILAALELGDPDEGVAGQLWLITNAASFHALYRTYRSQLTSVEYDRTPSDSSAVLIQYLIWYERDSRSLKEGKRL